MTTINEEGERENGDESYGKGEEEKDDTDALHLYQRW